jgi:hypothetical protein
MFFPQPLTGKSADVTVEAILVICPLGHTFVTLKVMSRTYTCPDCQQFFDQDLGQIAELID